MPKNINSITINITLEGIEKIKTEKNDNRTVWTITRAFTSWMAFIFPSMKMHNSWLEITKSCHSTLKNYRRHERKVRQSLVAKVTVWHNWLNRVRLAWSRKTYMHFATGHGATTRDIYIRSFFWKKRTTKNVRASTFLWEDCEFTFSSLFTAFSAMVRAWKWRYHFFHQRSKTRRREHSMASRFWLAA